MRRFWHRDARADGVPRGAFGPERRAQPSGWAPDLSAPAQRADEASVGQQQQQRRGPDEEGPEPHGPAGWTVPMAWAKDTDGYNHDEFTPRGVRTPAGAHLGECAPPRVRTTANAYHDYGWPQRAAVRPRRVRTLASAHLDECAPRRVRTPTRAYHGYWWPQRVATRPRRVRTSASAHLGECAPRRVRTQTSTYRDYWWPQRVACRPRRVRTPASAHLGE